MRYLLISLLFLSISFSAKSQTYTTDYQYKALESEKQPKSEMRISSGSFDIANDEINPNLNLTTEAVNEAIEILENKMNKEKSNVLRKKYKKTLKTMKARKKYIQTL